VGVAPDEEPATIGLEPDPIGVPGKSDSPFVMVHPQEIRPAVPLHIPPRNTPGPVQVIDAHFVSDVAKAEIRVPDNRRARTHDT